MSRVLVSEVIAATAALSGLPLAVVRGEGRGDRRVWDWRAKAMHVAYHLTGQSLAAIGRVFGRDHASVLHNVERINALRLLDAGVREDLMRIAIAASVPADARVRQGATGLAPPAPDGREAAS